MVTRQELDAMKDQAMRMKNFKELKRLRLIESFHKGKLKKAGRPRRGRHLIVFHGKKYCPHCGGKLVV